MRLIEVFLSEGEKDQYYRQLATKCADALVRYFSSGRVKVEYSGPTDHGVAAVYKGERIAVPTELVEYFKGLYFFIEGVPKASGISGASYEKMEDGRDIITLFIPLSREYDEDEWRTILDLNAGYWTADQRVDIMHEFVHLIDAHRAKNPRYMINPAYNVKKIYAGDKGEVQKYFNTPTEYNAYLQQELEKMDIVLRRHNAKSMDDAKRLFGVNDASSFVTKFLKNLHRGFKKNMTDDTRRRVVKRAHQYWKDLQRRLSG